MTVTMTLQAGAHYRCCQLLLTSVQVVTATSSVYNTIVAQPWTGLQMAH